MSVQHTCMEICKIETSHCWTQSANSNCLLLFQHVIGRVQVVAVMELINVKIVPRVIDWKKILVQVSGLMLTKI